MATASARRASDDRLLALAARDDIAATALADPARAPAALVQLLEQRYRALPDDVAILVASRR